MGGAKTKCKALPFESQFNGLSRGIKISAPAYRDILTGRKTNRPLLNFLRFGFGFQLSPFHILQAELETNVSPHLLGPSCHASVLMAGVNSTNVNSTTTDGTSKSTDDWLSSLPPAPEWVPFVIAASVIGGVVVLTIFFTCCCKCRARRKGKQSTKVMPAPYDHDDQSIENMQKAKARLQQGAAGEEGSGRAWPAPFAHGDQVSEKTKTRSFGDFSSSLQ